MNLKTTVDPQHITVRQDIAPATAGAEAQFSAWAGPPDQMEKLLPTFAAHPQTLRAGDISAIRDAARDFKLERDREKK